MLFVMLEHSPRGRTHRLSVVDRGRRERERWRASDQLVVMEQVQARRKINTTTLSQTFCLAFCRWLERLSKDANQQHAKTDHYHRMSAHVHRNIASLKIRNLYKMRQLVLAVDFLVYMGVAVALAGWPYTAWDAFLGSEVNTTVNSTDAFASVHHYSSPSPLWGPSLGPATTAATPPTLTQPQQPTVEAKAFAFASSLVAALSAVTALPGLVAVALPSWAGLQLGVLIYYCVASAAVLVVGLAGRSSLAHPNSTHPQLYIWLAGAGAMFIGNIITATASVLKISGISASLRAEDGEDDGEDARLLGSSGGGGGGGSSTATIDENDDDDDELLDGNDTSANGTRMKKVSELSASASASASSFLRRPTAVKAAAAAATAADAVEEQARSERQRSYGTWKLLQLAQPHKRVLYFACFVLCIRLPFSLSMPHWVSQVIGALFDKQWEEASWNIIYLVIAGTVDAALDFWAFYLFGLTQQRIIRDIRLDLFSAILRQEIGFFDKTGSGEITSRLTADCAEMANDLTNVFRFTLESLIRIGGIIAYMMARCVQYIFLTTAILTLFPVAPLYVLYRIYILPPFFFFLLSSSLFSFFFFCFLFL